MLDIWPLLPVLTSATTAGSATDCDVRFFDIAQHGEFFPVPSLCIIFKCLVVYRVALLLTSIHSNDLAFSSLIETCTHN